MYRLLLLLVALLAATFSPMAHAQDRIGVILMHGKQGSPTSLGPLVSQLEGAGHKVMAPSMPWSSGAWEKISLTMEQVFAQIDGYAAALRSQGATRIVVGGHSLGANVALAYAVDRGNLAGLVMAAPGHQPAFSYQRNNTIRADIDRARQLVEAGQGNQSFKGSDENQGRTFIVSTTAAVYWSWLDPNGRAAMQVQAPKLPAATPLMLVIGTKDVFYQRAENTVYKPAARNPYSKYVVVEADHVQTPFAAAKRITDWVSGLPR